MGEQRVKGTISQDGIVANMGNGIKTQPLAVAELVDNAIAAHFEASKNDTHIPKLKILLQFSKDRSTQVVSLQIKDNASGMSLAQVQNDLFHYMNRKKESKTQNEFGVGAKDALARLAGEYGPISLRTVVAEGGRKLETRIQMKSLHEIYTDGIIAEVTEVSADTETGTTWTVHSISGGVPVSNQAAMFSILGSVYRQPLRAGKLSIEGYDEDDRYFEAQYDEPKLLNSYPVGPDSRTVYFDKPKKEWKTPVDFVVNLPASLGVVGNELRVTGWVGVLQKMSANHYAGISLIRRDRVIFMGPTDRWKPDPPFTQGGSALDKSLTGELICNDLPTTQSKSDANNQFSDPIANALVQHLNDADPNGVLYQAKNYVKKHYQSSMQSQGLQDPDPVLASVAADTSPQVSTSLPSHGTSKPELHPGSPAESANFEPIQLGEFVHPHTGSIVELSIRPPEEIGGIGDPQWVTSNARVRLELQVNKLLYFEMRQANKDEHALMAVKALVAIAILESVDADRGRETRAIVKNLKFDGGQ